MKPVIIYGSTTGTTEGVANTISEKIGNATLMEVSSFNGSYDIDNSDLVIFGSSTWGIGDLQDDWIDKVDLLNDIDFSGKKVALFGTGDQEGYPDSFVSALKEIYDKVIARGGTVIGFTSTDGYTFDESDAVIDGKFIGLAIDEDCQSNLTDERITNWVAALKEEV